MIVWRVRGKLSGLFCTVLCATVVHSAMHTHMNRPNSCLLVRFSFSAVVLCYSLSVLDLAFWDYLVLQFICVCLLLLC